jgi:hypothetical protein
MTCGAIMFRQFNPTLIDVIDRPDVDAACACSLILLASAILSSSMGRRQRACQHWVQARKDSQ